MKHICKNKRHGTQAQTRDKVHRHRQETRYTGTDKREKMMQRLTNKET